ncbi:unnamed protein product [Closterium sp. NIES-65]|nr:unnamed protein product [Closterium sp. NIES-65]
MAALPQRLSHPPLLPSPLPCYIAGHARGRDSLLGVGTAVQGVASLPQRPRLTKLMPKVAPWFLSRYKPPMLVRPSASTFPPDAGCSPMLLHPSMSAKVEVVKANFGDTAPVITSIKAFREEEAGATMWRHHVMPHYLPFTPLSIAARLPFITPEAGGECGGGGGVCQQQNCAASTDPLVASPLQSHLTLSMTRSWRRVLRQHECASSRELEASVELVGADNLSVQATAYVAGMGSIPWTAYITGCSSPARCVWAALPLLARLCGCGDGCCRSVVNALSLPAFCALPIPIPIPADASGTAPPLLAAFCGPMRVGLRFRRSLPFVDRVTLSFVRPPQVSCAIKVMGALDAASIPLVASYVESCFAYVCYSCCPSHPMAFPIPLATSRSTLSKTPSRRPSAGYVPVVPLLLTPMTVSSDQTPNRLVVVDAVRAAALVLDLFTCVIPSTPFPLHPTPSICSPPAGGGGRGTLSAISKKFLSKKGKDGAAALPAVATLLVEVMEAKDLLAADSGGTSDPYPMMRSGGLRWTLVRFRGAGRKEEWLPLVDGGNGKIRVAVEVKEDGGIGPSGSDSDPAGPSAVAAGGSAGGESGGAAVGGRGVERAASDASTCTLESYTHDSQSVSAACSEDAARVAAPHHSHSAPAKLAPANTACTPQGPHSCSLSVLRLAHTKQAHPIQPHLKGFVSPPNIPCPPPATSCLFFPPPAPPLPLSLFPLPCPFFLFPAPFSSSLPLFPLPCPFFPLPCPFFLFPCPFSLFPAPPLPCPFFLFPAPFSLFPAPFPLPCPFFLFPAPFSFFPTPFSSFPAPFSSSLPLFPLPCPFSSSLPLFPLPCPFFLFPSPFPLLSGPHTYALPAMERKVFAAVKEWPPAGSPFLLKLNIFDRDMLTQHDPLGNAALDIMSLRDGARHALWVKLENVATGRVHVAVTVEDHLGPAETDDEENESVEGGEEGGDGKAGVNSAPTSAGS